MAIYDTYLITLNDIDNTPILINNLQNNLEYSVSFNVNNETISFTLMQYPRMAFIYTDTTSTRVYAFDAINTWYFFNNDDFALKYNEDFQVVLAIKQQ